MCPSATFIASSPTTQAIKAMNVRLVLADEHQTFIHNS